MNVNVNSYSIGVEGVSRLNANYTSLQQKNIDNNISHLDMFKQMANTIQENLGKENTIVLVGNHGFVKNGDKIRLVYLTYLTLERGEFILGDFVIEADLRGEDYDNNDEFYKELIGNILTLDLNNSLHHDWADDYRRINKFNGLLEFDSQIWETVKEQILRDHPQS